MTFRDLFKSSLRIIGAIAQGETPSATELADGLATFNDMLDSWSNETLYIFAKAIEDFSTVVSQGAYTMGPSGDFNTTRPMGIDGASIVSNANEYPMEDLTLDQWQVVQQKTTQSNIPTKFYQVDTYPLLTLNLWPVPSAVQTVRVYSWKALTQVATAGDTISLPPGYNQALKYNFAILLAPEYGRQIDPMIEAIATQSKAAIKRKNIKPRMLGMDEGVRHRRRFNIFTGE